MPEVGLGFPVGPIEPSGRSSMRNAINGIIGAGLCVFGLVVLQSDTSDKTAGWILIGIGGFFVLLFLLNLLAGSGEKHILENGTKGYCEILSLSETGMLVNERPQLQLEVRTWGDGIEPQTSSVKRVIGHDMLGRLQPGAVLAIRFPPGGKTDKWIFDRSQPAQAVASPPATSDIAGELERLTHLHQQGALSDAEFTKAKDRLL